MFELIKEKLERNPGPKIAMLGLLGATLGSFVMLYLWDGLGKVIFTLSFFVVVMGVVATWVIALKQSMKKRP